MIDINNMNIKEITLEDLLKDTVDRGDRDALEWLKAESTKEIACKGKNDTTIMKRQPVQKYRTRYLELFCGYKKTDVAKTTAKQKSDKKLADMFDAAFAQLT